MGGFSNVVNGVLHFPQHVIDWIKNDSSSLAHALNNVLEELVAYEKAHGKDPLEIAGKAGIDAYLKARDAGKSKGEAIIDGVKAAFEAEVPEIKKLSTNAMTAYISGKTV